MDYGIYNVQSTISSGWGDVTVTGTGGETTGTNYGMVDPGQNIGLYLEDTTITSGHHGSVTVKGTGGGFNGYQTDSDGIKAFGSTITSGKDGPVSVTGIGGSSVNGDRNRGIHLIGSTITSGEMGEVTVEGMGGNSGLGTMNFGIYLEQESKITSGGNDVHVTGTGGSGDLTNVGVYLLGSKITSEGEGNVFVTGTGGEAAYSDGDGLSGSGNMGIYLQSSTITSDDSGNVTINGTGGASPIYGLRNAGVWLTGGTISAGNGGNVAVTGTGGQGGGRAYGVYLGDASKITSATGSVTVSGLGGGMEGGEGQNFGVFLENNSTITSGIQGDPDPLPDIQPHSPDPDLGGTVTVHGTGGNGGDSNVGIYLMQNSSITSTNENSVHIIGIGGTSNSGSFHDGVDLQNSTIQALGTGNVSVHGIGGQGGGGNHNGIHLDLGASISSSGGDVYAEGHGGGDDGDNGYNVGVGIYGNAAIRAGGFGNTAVRGIGGRGNGNNFGIEVSGEDDYGQSLITSAFGNVSIMAGGGGHFNDLGQNDGVRVDNGGLITSGISGNLTVNGTGGAGNGYNYGVRVTGGGSISNYGGLTINGTGGGYSGDVGYNVGVGVESNGIIEGSGSLTVNGTGGIGGGHDYGILVSGIGTSIIPTLMPHGDGPPAGRIIGNASMTLTGQGGGSNGSQGYDDGIRVDSGGSIEGMSDSDLTITGTGGAFGVGQDDGIRITDNNSMIVANGDSLTVKGYGGGHGNSSFSSGIALLNGGRLIWGGYSGEGSSYYVEGNGGMGLGGGNDGLLIDGDGSAIEFDHDVDSGTDIEGYSGQPGAVPSYGIRMTNGASISGLPYVDPTVIVPNSNFQGVDLNLYTDSILMDKTSSLFSPNREVYLELYDRGTISGNISSEDFYKSGGGILTIEAKGNLDLGDLVVDSGTIILADVPAALLNNNQAYVLSDGTLTLGAGTVLPAVELEGGILNGSNPKGNAGAVYSDGNSTVSPGTDSTAGVIDLTSLSLNSSDTVVFKIGRQSNNNANPIPGVDYDQIQVVKMGLAPGILPLGAPGSAIHLNDATLDLEAFGSISTQPGAIYVLISNPAGGPIVGTFKDLPEGASVYVNGVEFHISYHGGSANNNDVILYNTAETTVSVTSMSGTSTYGGTVAILAQVKGIDTSLIPTGLLGFLLEDGTLLGTSLLDSSGYALFLTNAIPAGNHEIRVVFQGMVNFAMSTGTCTQIVNKATPIVALGSSLSSTVAGQVITLTGSVLPSAPGVKVPTGTVTFSDATTGTTLATNVRLVNGFASLSLTDLSLGSHLIQFTYNSGDSNYNPNNVAAGVSQTVLQDPTTTLQLVAPTSAFTESTVTLSAVLGARSGIPHGTVTFFDNGVPIGSAEANAQGVVSYTVANLSQGNHAFSASFTDSSGAFAPCNSTVANVPVTRNPLSPVTMNTEIVITPIYLAPPSSVPRSLGGRNTRVQFAVQVTTTVPGVPTPTGTITVYVNGRAVGTYALDATGTAIVTLRGQSIFNKTLSIRYNGDIQGVTTFSPSNSTPFVATKSFFYGNSPINSNSNHATSKKKSHPAGPKKLFRANNKVTMFVKAAPNQTSSH